MITLDPVDVSILALPGRIVLWILALAAYGAFFQRSYRLIHLLDRARSEDRFDRPGRRLKHFARYVLGQRRLFNEPIGIAHFFFFWGFLFFAGTFIWSLVRGLFPSLPIPYPDEIPIVSLILEILGILVLVSIVAAVIRRIGFPPPRLELTLDAYVILVLISLLVLSFLSGKGFAIAGEESAHAGWSPAGNLLAGAIRRSSALSASAERYFVASWWAHMVIVLGFMVYLPYSKHMHLLASPFNVFFGNLRPPGDLSVAGTGDDAIAGASRWDEFTWRQLLNGYACAECGRCDRVCPAVNSGQELSPKAIVHNLKAHLLEEGMASNRGNSTGGASGRSLIGEVIREKELWGCTTCYSCMEQCPVLNEHIPLIVQMRRNLVASSMDREGAMDSSLQDVLNHLARYGNSFGKSDRMRARWVKDLDFKVKDARREPVDALWFVGDYASYDPGNQDITRTVARIFRRAGFDFGIAYEGERNSGNDVRRIGEEGLYEMLREKNIETLGGADFRTIVTTDPHAYNSLKNEYPIGGNGHGTGSPRIIHYTELFDGWIREGTLKIRNRLNVTATYHDPCYLGRYNGIYEEPRRILRALGVRLLEMPRNFAKSYCCGAGGGRIWMEDPPGIEERPAESRIREAAELGGVSLLVVSCPKDISMFRDAVKTTGLEGRIEVKDIAELVWETLEDQPRKEG